MEKTNTVIVVQGKTFCDTVQNLKDSWYPFPLIFSTWEGSENCYTDDDIVLFNAPPNHSGTHNFNMQLVSSLSGFQKAKELGFNRVVKWRSDFVIQEPQLLLNTFKPECLNLYAWHKHTKDVTDGYITDFFMEGDVDDLIQLFEIRDIHPPYPEFAFTRRLFEIGLNNKVNFICKELCKDGADVYWTKHGYWLSDNVSQPQYKNSICSE